MLDVEYVISLYDDDLSYVATFLLSNLIMCLFI